MRTGRIKLKKQGMVIVCLITAVWVLCGMISGAESVTKQKNGTVPIYFFHNTACGTCDGTEEFREIVKEQISGYQNACSYEILEYNVFKTGGKEEWDAIAKKYHLQNEGYIFPVMVLDGKMYRGMAEIQEQLHTAFLKAAGVSALYFYREDCPECLDMEPFWDQLPEELVTEEGEYPLNVLELESRTDDNGEQIQWLFKKYQVPDEDQMVPFVFLKDGYLAGQQGIEENLVSFLEEGRGFLSAEEQTGETEDEVMVSESGKMLE